MFVHKRTAYSTVRGDSVANHLKCKWHYQKQRNQVDDLVEATAVLVVSQLLILNKYLYINKRINTNLKGCIFLAPF